MKTFDVGKIRISSDSLILIAGPCVIESRELVMRTAEALGNICQRVGFPVIFKSSYAKMNRTSIDSFSGLGIDKGLKILESVKSELGMPLTTDFHSAGEADVAAQVVDMLQIPAFLVRQTDILLAAGKTRKPVNVKKGQFLAPEDMAYVVEKIESTGNRQVMLTERGTAFGYHDLVVDMRSLGVMKATGYPVAFDATHAVSLNPSKNENRKCIEALSRAAVAVGVDAIFIETHPDPPRALSDGARMLPLDRLAELLERLKRIKEAVRDKTKKH